MTDERSNNIEYAEPKPDPAFLKACTPNAGTTVVMTQFKRRFVRSGVLVYEKRANARVDFTSMGPIVGSFALGPNVTSDAFFDAYEDGLDNCEQFFLMEKPPSDTTQKVIPYFDIDITHYGPLPRRRERDHVFGTQCKLDICEFIVKQARSYFRVEPSLGAAVVMPLDHFLCRVTQSQRYSRNKDGSFKDGLHVYMPNFAISQRDWLEFSRTFCEYANNNFTPSSGNANVTPNTSTGELQRTDFHFDDIAAKSKMLVGSRKKLDGPFYFYAATAETETFCVRGGDGSSDADGNDNDETSSPKRKKPLTVRAEYLSTVTGDGAPLVERGLRARDFSIHPKPGGAHEGYNILRAQALLTSAASSASLQSTQSVSDDVIEECRRALTIFREHYAKLNVRFADDCGNWTRMMFMLKKYGCDGNMEQQALDLFIAYSRMSEKKFAGEQDCRERWARVKLRTDGGRHVRIGTFFNYLGQSIGTDEAYKIRRSYRTANPSLFNTVDRLIFNKQLSDSVYASALYEITGSRLSISVERKNSHDWRLFCLVNDDLLRPRPNEPSHECFAANWSPRWIKVETSLRNTLLYNLYRIFVEQLSGDHAEFKDTIIAYGLSHRNNVAMLKIIEDNYAERNETFDLPPADDQETNTIMIAYRNGVINTATGDFREHNIEHRILNYLNYDFDYECDINAPGADGAESQLAIFLRVFNAFFPEIADAPKDERAEIIDDALTPLANEVLRVFFSLVCSPLKHFLLCFGPTNTGKTVFIKILNLLFGQLFHSMDKDKLRSCIGNRNSHDEGLVPLVGKMLINFSELNSSERMMALELLKKLTGLEDLNLRRFMEPSGTYPTTKPTWTIMFNTNAFPASTDLAVLGRMVVIRFLKRFSEGRTDFVRRHQYTIRTVFWHLLLRELRKPAERNEDLYYDQLMLEKRYPILYWMTEDWKREHIAPYRFVRENLREVKGKYAPFKETFERYLKLTAPGEDIKTTRANFLKDELRTFFGDANPVTRICGKEYITNMVSMEASRVVRYITKELCYDETQGLPFRDICKHFEDTLNAALPVEKHETLRKRERDDLYEQLKEIYYSDETKSTRRIDRVFMHIRFANQHIQQVAMDVDEGIDDQYLTSGAGIPSLSINEIIAKKPQPPPITASPIRTLTLKQIVEQRPQQKNATGPSIQSLSINEIIAKKPRSSAVVPLRIEQQSSMDDR